MTQDGYTCERRYFRDQSEFKRWFEFRSSGFGPWYVSPDPPRWSLLDNRHVANCKAALFPQFMHQLRDAKGEAVGYLATVPGYWAGDPNSLHTFQYISDTLNFNPLKTVVLTGWYLLTMELLRSPALFERVARKVRAKNMAGANAVYLIAILVAPELRKQRLPQKLLERANTSARELGYDYVVAPFRPNAYGKFKAARKAQHTDELFAQYCNDTDAEGLPVDPWLHTVVRLGARLLKLVPRSFWIRGSLAQFERLRQTYRPDDWYTPAPDVWECGETCTWYVDRARRIALSVESNYWGAFDLRSKGVDGAEVVRASVQAA